MTLQQLTYVVALAKYRHFSRAAKACSVAQPTLTLQIKKVETEIGAPLFDRSRQPVEPTELGLAFTEKARLVLAEMADLKELVKGKQDQMSGEFSLGVMPTLAPYLLPGFLPAFSEKYPNVFLNVREAGATDLMEQLEKGLLDLALLATPLEERRLRELPLFYEPLVAFPSANHPLVKKKSVKRKDIDHQGLWLPSKEYSLRNQIVNLCRTDPDFFSPKGFALQSGSLESLKNLVRGGRGYALLPELSLISRTEKNGLRRFDGKEPAREISLVVHTRFSKQILLDGLAEEIRAAVPGRMLKKKDFEVIEWR